MRTPNLPSPSRALSSESSFTAPNHAIDPFDHVASLSSTPPTTVTDSMSLASDASKHDRTAMADASDADPASSNPIDVHEQLSTEPTIEAAALPVIEAADLADSSLPAHSQPATAQSTPNASPATLRTRRQRVSAPIYNLSKLSGTSGHGKRRSKGDEVSDRRRRRKTAGDAMSADAPIDSLDDQEAPESPALDPDTTAFSAIDVYDVEHAFRNLAEPKSKSKVKAAKKVVAKATKASKNATTIEDSSRRITTRGAAPQTETLANKVSSLGKRAREAVEEVPAKMSRELRRLQDTNEFSGIDVKPVLYTTWANGKFVDPNARPERPKKKAKLETPKEPEPEPAAEEPVMKKRRVKQWLNHGLYAGQATPADVTKCLTPAEKKSLAQMPELVPSEKPNRALPMPIYGGMRALVQGKDFKLPFDICNPLPPGQPKPESWRQMTRNRFIGDAGPLWKKNPHYKDYQSKCVCKPDDGCAEDCQNRIMLYECDETNCNVGRQYCQNRAFQQLGERTKAGGKFRVGVEVFKTANRGYGIRANRGFEANQIIMEYTGEIITEEECDRRMNEKYKNNECYYLMSFDQNMIIDATSGSAARFVNHSCTPNCQMIKWIVSGNPRMALFAGDRPITTGEELTYDYNFDPFSAKNVQKCLCGSENCRGVLGPKPKEVKQPKPPKVLAKKVKKSVAASKRKLSEALDNAGSASKESPAKKRKIKATASKLSPKKSTKKSLPEKSLKAAKGAATVIKRKVSTISVKSKAASATGAKNTTAGKTAAAKKSSVVKKTSTAVKVQSKLTGAKKTGDKSKQLTLAAGTAEKKTKKAAGKKTPAALSSAKGQAASPSPRKGVDLKRSPNKIK